MDRNDVKEFLNAGLSSTLSYDANGGSGALPPAAFPVGSSITLADGAALSRNGFLFDRGNTAADGSGVSYAAYSPIVVGHEDLVLYAVWEGAHTVRYDGNGNACGTVPSALGYLRGSSVTAAQNSGSLYKTADYVFSGWNTNGDGKGTDYPVGSTFTMGSAGVTLYAVWKKIDGIVGGDAVFIVPSGVVRGATDRKGNRDDTYFGFTSTAGRVTIQTSAQQFATTDDLSMSVRFKLDALPSGQINIVSQDGDVYGFQYSIVLPSGVSGNEKPIMGWVGRYNVGGNKVLAKVTKDVWYHAVTVYTASSLTLTFYLQGALVGTTPFTYAGAPKPSATTSVKLGGPNPFSGTIGDVRIYNRALSAAEVVQLYDD